jgi:hypothetical protein
LIYEKAAAKRFALVCNGSMGSGSYAAGRFTVASTDLAVLAARHRNAGHAGTGVAGDEGKQVLVGAEPGPATRGGWP